MNDLPDFLASEFDPAPPERALFHVIPAPLEATASFGAGAAHGPAAILEASQQLETLCQHADGSTSAPGAMGIHTVFPVDCSLPLEAVVEDIEVAVGRALSTGAVPVLLGGEHTVTMGALRALAHRAKPVGVIQFDAHADLRDTYQDTPYSHACVMRRALDLDLHIFQIGVRSLSPEEDALRREHAIPGMDAHDLHRLEAQGRPLPDPLLPEDFPQDIYVTFDVDGLDPSVIPATGTPEPGGLSWWQAMDLLDAVAKGRRIVGLDVVELAPPLGPPYAAFAAARLAYNMMGVAARSHGRH